jgi:hypothetical protein
VVKTIEEALKEVAACHPGVRWDRAGSNDFPAAHVPYFVLREVLPGWLRMLPKPPMAGDNSFPLQGSEDRRLRQRTGGVPRNSVTLPTWSHYQSEGNRPRAVPGQAPGGVPRREPGGRAQRRARDYLHPKTASQKDVSATWKSARSS